MLWNGIKGLGLARLPSAVHNLLDHIITLLALALLTAVGPAVSPPSAAANNLGEDLAGICHCYPESHGSVFEGRG